MPVPRAWLKRTVVGMLMAGALALGTAVWWSWPRYRAFYSDANTIRRPVDTVNPRDVLWQPPIRPAAPLNTPQDDYEPRISPDGLTLYFVRGKAGRNADLFISHRTREGWSEPEPLSAVNSEADDLGPEPSQNGELLYFYSNRPGGSGGYDIWVARKGSDGYLPPSNLGPGINSPFNDYGPALTPDGRTLYFASNRPRAEEIAGPKPDGWPATIREDLYDRDYDLHFAAVTESGVGTAQPVTSVNTTYNEGAPAVSPVGDFLYFASDRPGGSGGFDVYRTRRLRGGHEPPANLGPDVNTSANELDPGLTMGGFGIWFSSDRRLADASTEHEENYDLYYSASREVFRDVELQPRASLDWAAFWREVGPHLPWALLALLLLLLLYFLLGQLRNRRLSLLTKCLLASLLAHVLLLLLLSTWAVTAGLAQHWRGRSLIQVALGSAALGDQIADQIRGELTEIGPPDVEWPSVPRSERLWETPMNSPPAQLPVESRRITIELPKERLDVPDSNVRWTPGPSIPTATVPLASSPAALQFQLPNEARTHAEPDPPTEMKVAPAPVNKENIRPVPAVPSFTHANSHVAVTVPLADQRIEAISETLKTVDHVSLRALDAAPPSPAPIQTIYPVVEEPMTLPGTAVSFSIPAETSRVRTEETTGPPIEAPSDLPSIGRPNLVPPARVLAITPVLAPAPAESQAFRSLGSAEAKLDVSDSRTPASEAYFPATPHADISAAALSSQFNAPRMEETPARQPPTKKSKDTPEPAAPVELHASRWMLEQTIVPAASAPIHSMAELSPTMPPSSHAANLKSPGAELNLRSEMEKISDSAISLASTKDLNGTPTAAPPQRIPLATESVPAAEFRLPEEIVPPKSAFPQRAPDQRMALVERMGGSPETERAVARALEWLARHQSDNGSWDGEDFDRGCGQCGGRTDVQVDAALTGLSLLCFLGADHTHIKDGPYRSNVNRALNWLAARQGEDGDLRGEETMYSHGIAAIALAEALAMTGDPQLRDPVGRAVEFIAGARNRDVGGWRYDPGQAGDTSVLGWQIMALKSAKTAGLAIPDGTFEAARRWMELVTVPGRPGLYAYQPGRQVTPAMTAEGMFVQLLLGLGPADPRTRASADFIAKRLPDWDEEPNTYFWYYATLALFQQQGEHWTRWNDRLTEQLLAHQRPDARAAGSWDPQGEWADIGGRVYQTALCALMLEVYYRYLPMYAAPLPTDALGRIEGRVTDVDTGRPLAAAMIRLDRSNEEPLLATSDADGRYGLAIPEVPPHFAVSASADGFLPRSVNVETESVRGRTWNTDFALERRRSDVVPIESVPEVHHLGDNRFEGRINSQFQRQAEGAVFTAEFVLDTRPPPEARTAELRMLVKGVQRRHRIFINGTLLDERLDEAPDDGSFGEFSTMFDAGLLRHGTNVLEIHATSSAGDVDDFEFVNLEIRLQPSLVDVFGQR